MCVHPRKRTNLRKDSHDRQKPKVMGLGRLKPRTEPSQNGLFRLKETGLSVKRFS